MANIAYAKLEETDTLSLSEIHGRELEVGVLTLFGSSFLFRMHSRLLTRGNWGFVAKA